MKHLLIAICAFLWLPGKHCSAAVSEKVLFTRKVNDSKTFNVVFKSASLEDNKFIQRKYFGNTNHITANTYTNMFFFEFRIVEKNGGVRKYFLRPAAVNSQLRVLDVVLDDSPTYFAVLYMCTPRKVCLYESSGKTDSRGDAVFSDKAIPFKLNFHRDEIKAKLIVEDEKVSQIHITKNNAETATYRCIQGQWEVVMRVPWWVYVALGVPVLAVGCLLLLRWRHCHTV